MFGSDELTYVGNSLSADGPGEIGLPLRVKLAVGKSSEGFQALQQSTPVLLLHALLLHKRVRLILPSLLQLQMLECMVTNGQCCEREFDKG
ncbi:unnamed protein product [Urochloa humidicola]